MSNQGKKNKRFMSRSLHIPNHPFIFEVQYFTDKITVIPIQLLSKYLYYELNDWR